MKETQLATQEQRGGVGGLAIAAVVVGGLFLFSRRGADGGGGDGGGGGGGITPGPDVPAGMASVGGGISGVTVSQEAGMGQLSKAVGETLLVELRFVGETRKDGVSIEWPYYMIARIGHSTLFGWRTAGSRGIPNFTDLNGANIQFPIATQQLLVTVSGGRTRLPSMVIPNDPGVTWDVRVQLRAQESDSLGRPNGTWMNLGSEFREDGAFVIAQASSSAIIGGGISGVTVAQPGPAERLPLPSSGRRGLRLTGRG